MTLDTIYEASHFGQRSWKKLGITLARISGDLFRYLLRPATVINKALFDAAQRQTEREIGRYFETRGGQLTDSIERAIERQWLKL